MPIQAQAFDGSVHEFPDGTQPEIVDKAMKDYTQSQNVVDPTTGMTFGGLKGAAVIPTEAAKGIPVAGAFVPDTAETKEFEESHPGLAAATRGVGSALSMAPAIAMAPEVFGLGGAGLLPSLAAGGSSGAVIGAADAAARGQPIVQGGVTGAVEGAGGVVGGKLLGGVFKGIANLLSPKAQGALAGVDPKALEWASTAAKQAGLTDQAIADKLTKLGPDGFLAEYAPEFMGLARGVAGAPGTAKNAMVQAFENRVTPEAVSDRTTQGLDKLLGKPINRVQQTIEDVEDRAQTAGPLFNQWRTATIQPTKELKDIVTGLEEKGFLKEANELAEARALAGKPVPSMKNFFTTGERKDWPTAESYGYLRRAISNRIAAEDNPDLIRAWRGVRDRLDAAIEDSNQPAAKIWKQAREEWGTRSEVMKAREQGNNAWNPNYTFEQLAEDVTNMSPAERAAFKENARSALASMSERTETGDKSVGKLLRSESAQKKLRFLAENKQVTPKDVDAFVNQVEREPAMAQATKDIGTSTQKLANQRMQEMITPNPEDTLVARAASRMHYSPHVTPMSYLPIVGALKKAAGRRQEAAFEAARDSLAPLLHKQGQSAHDVAKALLNYQPINKSAAASAGRKTAGVINALLRPSMPDVPVPFLPPQFGGTTQR